MMKRIPSNKKSRRNASVTNRSVSGRRKTARGEKKRRGSGGRQRNITGASPKSESEKRRRIREKETRRRPS